MGCRVIGEDRSRLPGRGTVRGKLGENDNEKVESAIGRRREHTDLGLDLGESEEQVACHGLALALAMTDEASRKADRMAFDAFEWNGRFGCI